MDSKYSSFGNKPHITKFHIKSTPKLVHFNGNGNTTTNGVSPPKKIKLDNGTAPPNKPILNVTFKRKVDLQEQRKKLPIYQNRREVLETIRRHSTLIILSETGSGKTTQIPQYILSARLQNEGKIAVTQPRRVAAITVAQRVAQELNNGSTVGEEVGYSVRFEDVTSKRTKIKYLTDGMLLREAMCDSLLLEYTVVVLDEAHERTIHTDVLFGIVKQAQKIRQDKNLKPLKIIIMSATMDVDHFSKYFNNCHVYYQEGRTYPVNMFNTVKPHDDYTTASVQTFFQIHQEAPPNHDVLIFLTGQEEIETVAHHIRLLSKDPSVNGPPVKVCTLYAAQQGTHQMIAFQPAAEGTRKVVVSTNIAETSVTIPGIKYVIDSGMVKMRMYHPATGLDMLKVQRTSQEQAWQRAGRAGRESEGFCYRLYTRNQFEQMHKSTVPEIQRTNLNSVVLQLLALGIHAVYFDFMDKPPKESILAAFEQLKLLGAVENVDSKQLTPLGKKMAKFPLEPRFAKILLSAQEYGCVDEILTIVSLLSIESIFLNPTAKQEQAQAARQKFYSPWGDHITLLNVYKEYDGVGQKNKKNWCYDHFINMRNMLLAREVRGQLGDICQKCDIDITSCGGQLDQVRKCLISGLFMNVAQLHKDRQYITLDKRQVVSLHPSSVLNGQQPHFILFTEVIQTSKCFLRNVTTIEKDWLEEIMPDYIRTHNIRINGVN